MRGRSGAYTTAAELQGLAGSDQLWRKDWDVTGGGGRGWQRPPPVSSSQARIEGGRAAGRGRQRTGSAAGMGLLSRDPSPAGALHPPTEAAFGGAEGGGRGGGVPTDGQGEPGQHLPAPPPTFPRGPSGQMSYAWGSDGIEKGSHHTANTSISDRSCAWFGESSYFNIPTTSKEESVPLGGARISVPGGRGPLQSPALACPPHAPCTSLAHPCSRLRPPRTSRRSWPQPSTSLLRSLSARPGSPPSPFLGLTHPAPGKGGRFRVGRPHKGIPPPTEPVYLPPRLDASI